MGPKRDKQNELSERQCLDSGTQDAGKTGVLRPLNTYTLSHMKCSENSSEREQTVV